jgi:hypothetical protein
MSTNILVKYPSDLKQKVLDFTADLGSNETLVSAVVSTSSPIGLDVSITEVMSPLVTVTAGPGQDFTTYGVNVLALTSTGRTITYLLAVSVDSQLAYNLQTQNPDAFNTLVDSLEAGQAALGVGAWSFPPTVDCIGGHILWELIDQEGVTYANGNAFTYSVISSGLSNRVEGQALISCPSSIPVNLEGQRYQIRWSLYLPGTTVPSYSFENIRIVALNTVPQGVEDVVELVGDNVTLSMVLNRSFEHVGFEIYHQNTLVVPLIEVIEKIRVSDGWFFRGTINISKVTELYESTTPYTVIWSYWNNATDSIRERQTGRLFLINATIMSAVEDAKSMLNKARTTINGSADLLFTTPIVLAYLRRGKDAFNGAYGMLTSFDMTNAQGAIREFWLMYSEMMALRAQFLAEGEKVFNYSGTAISLDVDRTSYYDSLASNIQSRIEAEVKVFKMNLIKKGILGGPGSLENISARPGATGAISITLSPASSLGRFAPLFTRWK